MKVLLKHAFELSTFLLEGGELPTFPRVHESFPPFAVGILSSGEISDFNCLPNPEKPGSVRVFCLPDQLAMFRPTTSSSFPHSERQCDEVSSEPSSEKVQSPSYQPPPIEAVRQGIREFASRGMIHAVALVDHVRDFEPASSNPVYAIRVQIEHVETEPVTWYLPCQLQDQKLVFWKEIEEKGQPFIFAD
jgi:hypothetical protein